MYFMSKCRSVSVLQLDAVVFEEFPDLWPEVGVVDGERVHAWHPFLLHEGVSGGPRAVWVDHPEHSLELGGRTVLDPLAVAFEVQKVTILAPLLVELLERLDEPAGDAAAEVLERLWKTNERRDAKGHEGTRRDAKGE